MKASDNLTATPRSAVLEGADTDKAEAESLAAAKRHRQIPERAYFHAAACGFAGDRQIEDWLTARQEIDAMTVPQTALTVPKRGVDKTPSAGRVPFKGGKT